MLMLEHKQVPYRRVDIVTLWHPLVVRLRGFDSGGQTRSAGARRPFALRIGDHLGTVPALACNEQRVSTNYRIARFLDDRHTGSPLLPPDLEQRRTVEEAERWANDTLQMAARRIVVPAAVRDPAGFSRSAADGRMGYLLYRRGLARRLIVPLLGRFVFAADEAAERELLARLPRMLDRIDAWISQGILDGAHLNVADFMIAPSLALILYRTDVRSLFEGRPALELVDRLLPEQRCTTPSRA
jgi:glutathione S-transferase